ncbi:UPF0481 protein [Camellia lanceoleosa]|nr:UPF0481 protein [Camellia lanceoleosa]
MVEEQKLRYLQLLLKSKNENSADKYVTAIRLLEQEACRCYAEPISLTVYEMIEMMLLEGCFIIELMQKFEMEFLRDKNDSIFEMNWMVNSLQGDLMLLESQLPFLVLCKLFPSSSYRECVNGNSNFKLMLLIEEDASNRKGNWSFIPNTTELREAGLKVEKVVEEGNLLAIKFQTDVLQIPPLTIKDMTESFFRNLIVYEQYCIDNHLSYVPD